MGDGLVYSDRGHIVGLHVWWCACVRASCGLVFMWFVFHAVVVKCGLLHSVRGITVGFRVFVIVFLIVSSVFRWIFTRDGFHQIPLK